MRNLKKIYLPLFLIGFGLLMPIVVIETIFYFLNAGEQVSTSQSGGYTNGFFVRQNPLGYLPRANSVVDSVETSSIGETIYDVKYSIDSYSRRLTIPASQNVDKFVIFTGCSFVFGEGLNDQDTLPSQFQKISPDYHAYNLAFSGWGPQHTYVRLLETPYTEGIKEKHGILVYVLLDGHIERVVGDMHVTQWCKYCPYVSLDSDGHLVHEGTFFSAMPLRTMWFKLLANSNVVKYYGLNFPTAPSNDDYVRTARILEGARDAFHKNYPDERFVVVLYPGSKRVAMMKPLLSRYGVPFLDYSEEDFTAPHYHLHPRDQHPSAFANAKLAELLARDLPEVEGAVSPAPH